MNAGVLDCRDGVCTPPIGSHGSHPALKGEVSLCLIIRLSAFVFLFWILSSTPVRAEGSIQHHLTLDLIPLAMSVNNPIGRGFGFSYDRTHDQLKSSYVITVEASIPFQSDNHRIDMLGSLAFFTEVTKAFSLGGRVGVVFNDPNEMSGIGAIGLRLPALFPNEKKFFSFFFEEVDLGVSGAGNRYASFRLGMLLL